jgi:hypothetical protein
LGALLSRAGVLASLAGRLSSGSTGSLASLASLAGRLPRLPRGSTGSLAETAHRLSGCLLQSLPEAAQTLTDATERLACGAAELPHSSPGAERLPGRVRKPAKCLTRGSAGLNGLLRRLAHVVERLRHCAARPERLLTQVADVVDRVIDGLDEALEDLWIAIECREGSIEDVVEVLEADLEPRLRINPFDVDLDLPEVDVDTGHDLEEVRQLGAKREVGLQLLDVDVDLVDVHLVDVYEDIRVVARLAALEMPGVHFARRARPCRRPRPIPVSAATFGAALSSRTLRGHRASSSRLCPEKTSPAHDSLKQRAPRHKRSVPDAASRKP